MKKKYKVLVSLLAIGLVLTYLANRDLVKIYGGHTEQVDANLFVAVKGPLLINNINVLSADGQQFIAKQSIYIKNGLIEAIGSDLSVKGEYTAIDGSDKYIIPGLTDAHVHLFKSHNDLLLYVANGVTQVRELIGEPDHLEWRKEIQAGRIGPDLFIASPRIGSFGGMEGFFMSWSQGYANLSTVDEATAAVKAFKQQGYDAVKIYSQINQEAYQAVTETAYDLGMKVVGHVPWNMTMGDIGASQDSVAHLEEVMNALNREFGDYGPDNADEFLQFVEDRSAAVAAELVEQGVAVSTTLWLVESFIRQKESLHEVLSEVELEYQNPGISEWSEFTPRGLGWLPEVNRYKWSDDWDEARRARSAIYWRAYAKACQIILRHLNDQGVTIMTGTDANLPPTVPGFSLHAEFISLNKAGMSPAQILNASTAVPAAWLNKKSGQVLPGYQASLVILDKNPLLDISHTQTIDSVILNGQFLNRQLLDDMLAAVKAANDASRTVDISQYLK